MGFGGSTRWDLKMLSREIAIPVPQLLRLGVFDSGNERIGVTYHDESGRPVGIRHYRPVQKREHSKPTGEAIPNRGSRQLVRRSSGASESVHQVIENSTLGIPQVEIMALTPSYPFIDIKICERVPAKSPFTLYGKDQLKREDVFLCLNEVDCWILKTRGYYAIAINQLGSRLENEDLGDLNRFYFAVSNIGQEELGTTVGANVERRLKRKVSVHPLFFLKTMPNWLRLHKEAESKEFDRVVRHMVGEGLKITI
jgi:hypothetical protein